LKGEGMITPEEIISPFGMAGIAIIMEAYLLSLED
jgi:hypothetical protein